ncbi:hypothetical protein [Ideonella livida]|uniref:Uncharacterized protein n=1 Tax=Ideonella livida TaxID=2707176 RepID=A0A7C9PKU8_9BURK|nr:hypothetical protein [Ideonella livida]NDY93832.1 hypothetical protein [Ideonella livida]
MSDTCSVQLSVPQARWPALAQALAGWVLSTQCTVAAAEPPTAAHLLQLLQALAADPQASACLTLRFAVDDVLCAFQAAHPIQAPGLGRDEVAVGCIWLSVRSGAEGAGAAGVSSTPEGGAALAWRLDFAALSGALSVLLRESPEVRAGFAALGQLA